MTTSFRSLLLRPLVGTASTMVVAYLLGIAGSRIALLGLVTFVFLSRRSARMAGATPVDNASGSSTP